MLAFSPKDPNETITAQIDWSGRLGSDTIVTSSFVVALGTVILTSPMLTTNGTSVVISGGTDGGTSVIQNTITTVSGQTLEQSISILVESSQLLPPYGNSTTTKGDILDMAYEELASSGDEFDHSPEEDAMGLRRLDALMADWLLQGIDLGYNQPAILGQGDRSDYAGIPDGAVNAVVPWLCARMSVPWAKTLTGETRRAMQSGLNMLRTLTTTLPTVRLAPGTPYGSGNKWRSLYRPIVPNYRVTLQ